MEPVPTALIISDFPIITATARAVFEGRYQVESIGWAAYTQQPNRQADLLVIDVTAMSAESALALLARKFPRARVVVCSLHHNEVEVYRIEAGGPVIEGAFPSLLALAA